MAGAVVFTRGEGQDAPAGGVQGQHHARKEGDRHLAVANAPDSDWVFSIDPVPNAKSEVQIIRLRK